MFGLYSYIRDEWITEFINLSKVVIVLGQSVQFLANLLFGRYDNSSVKQGRFPQLVIRGWFLQSLIICKFIASIIQNVKYWR